jgi:hypothetical protein
MNACAHSLLNAFLKMICSSLIVVQMAGWKLEQVEVEGYEPT